MTSSTIISIKQYYCNKQLLDPPPGPKKKLCFAVEIKDGFISHYNSLKKKIQVQFNTSIYFRKGNNSY